MSTRPESGLSRLTKRFSTRETAFSMLPTPIELPWPTMPSTLPSVLSITPPTTPVAAEPSICSARSAPAKIWPLNCAPPAIEDLSWLDVDPAPRRASPLAFSRPSIVTLMVPPNWLVPAVLRSISPRLRPLASPLKS